MKLNGSATAAFGRHTEADHGADYGRGGLREESAAIEELTAIARRVVVFVHETSVSFAACCMSGVILLK
jgi:hypothetical protein